LWERVREVSNELQGSRSHVSKEVILFSHCGIPLSLEEGGRKGGRYTPLHGTPNSCKKTLLVQLTSVTVNGVSATVVRGVGTDACRHKTERHVDTQVSNS